MTRLLAQFMGLTLAADAPIDLHMHTNYSDGRWPAQQLIDYLVKEQFQLIAVTDHDRVDKVAEIQQLGAAQGLPILSGVEMSTVWRDKMAHMLCYGFDPEHNALGELIQKVLHLQLENTYEVNENLRRQGYAFPLQEEALVETGGQLRRPFDNAVLLFHHGHAGDRPTAMRMISEAGFYPVKARMAEVVEAAHQSNAVCLIAHPGRRERGFTYYDTALLDELRAEIPIDGIEIYHPYHDKDTIAAYLDYVQKHHLLLSTGSDSHSTPNRMPTKHRADISRKLLERLDIAVR